MNQLQALENLIIVTLLQEPQIKEYRNGNVDMIQVQLQEGKETFFTKYVTRYKLENHVTFSRETNLVKLHQSIVIERLVRDWTTKGEVIGLDPSKLSSELFMLWICLFGRKTEKNVVIDTTLDDHVKHTVCRFFTKYLKTTLIDKGIVFQIMPFTNILLKSYQEKGALEETEELNKLLTDKERVKLKNILLRWEHYHEII